MIDLEQYTEAELREIIKEAEDKIRNNVNEREKKKIEELKALYENKYFWLDKSTMGCKRGLYHILSIIDRHSYMYSAILMPTFKEHRNADITIMINTPGYTFFSTSFNRVGHEIEDAPVKIAEMVDKEKAKEIISWMNKEYLEDF